MYVKAKKILASELMYALEMNEVQVEEHLYALLADAGHSNGTGRLAAAAK